MRLKNKIRIKGDTLQIFEEVDKYNGFKVGDFVKIEPAAAQQSGLDPDKSYEIQGFVNYGKGMSKSINAVLDKELYKPYVYPPKGIISVKFITKEVSEGSFNPMKGGADKYSTIDKDVRGFIHVFAYPDPKGIETIDGLNQWETEDASNREVHFVGSFKEANATANSFINESIKQYLEEGEDEIDFDDENFSDPMIDDPDSMNELRTYNNNPVTSKYNGKTITWDDYEVVEKNVDGGGYTDAIILMGSDEDGNEYTCEGSTTHGDVDEWDDSTIEMVKSINEAKKAKTDPKDKKKAEKTNYGHKDMSDVDMVNPYELRKGIRIEMVDIDDYEKAMDKAVKKLKKDPMFYSNLIANVKETKGKRSDISTEIKDKKLNKVSDKLKDKANEMEVSKKDATKKNANDSLNKKEKASGKPKGVKEMTMKPKASKGMKSMTVPGKEKKTNLKENVNLWEAFKKNILR